MKTICKIFLQIKRFLDLMNAEVTKEPLHGSLKKELLLFLFNDHALRKEKRKHVPLIFVVGMVNNIHAINDH